MNSVATNKSMLLSRPRSNAEMHSDSSAVMSRTNTLGLVLICWVNSSVFSRFPYSLNCWQKATANLIHSLRNSLAQRGSKCKNNARPTCCGTQLLQFKNTALHNFKNTRASKHSEADSLEIVAASQT